MKMSDLALAVKNADADAKSTTHAFLFYGPPKSGKTELVATIAKAPEYDRIFWFDNENGSATILRMYKDGKLTLADLEKIIIIKIPDTREDPTAIETMLKAICSRNAVTICEDHGRVDCVDCKKAGRPAIPFHYRSLTKRDALVIDSMSQTGASAMNLACRGKSIEFKPTFDEYGASGKWLGDLLTVIQAAQFCDIYCITHVQIMEDENKNDIYYPLCGTKAFSANVAKYFGTVVFVNKKLKKHRAESSTTSSMVTLAGSRLGIELEKSAELDLVGALRNAGFLPPLAGAIAEPAVAVEKPAFGSRFGNKE